MEEGQLLMTQTQRDRLVALKKVKKNLITQREAAEEIGISTRQVRRLMGALAERGDKAVIHGLTGRPSAQRIEAKIEKKAVAILSREEYRDFGPTLASEYLRDLHGIEASKETVRQWMMRAKLWKRKKAKVEEIHQWRERRSRVGEMVQWDTSDHDWLEGRGKERIYLITMIDDATSRLEARFVLHDSTEENMRMLQRYVEKHGRPVMFYTDKASLFQTAEKRRRDDPGAGKDPVEMPPTQIGRALRELNIAWTPAHSAQAKGRVERSFLTAQDRLVKGMRIAGVNTAKGANEYLDKKYLVWWEKNMTVAPANPDDAHRPMDRSHNLAASLSHVETRQVKPDYTFSWHGERWLIDRADIVAGMRGAVLRVERRLDGSLAARFRERYLRIRRCGRELPQPEPTVPPKRKAPARKGPPNPDWNKNFDLKKAPRIWEAQRASERNT